MSEPLLTVTSENPSDAKKIIENLEKILLDVQRISLTSISSEAANNLDFHMGQPTESQLQKICAYTGKESSAEDWFVMTAMASNNLINRSIRKWHPNVLRQMEAYYPGRPLILNHDWDDCSEAVGLIYDAKLINSTTAPEEALNRPSMVENQINQGIVNREGYSCLYVMCAIDSSLTNLVDGIQSRRLNDVSTGGLLNSVRLICPDCTAEMGREVTFTETDKFGEYTCKHLIPWRLSDIGCGDDMDDDEEDEYPYASYLELDGIKDMVELSLCQCGNLPMAKIYRGS